MTERPVQTVARDRRPTRRILVVVHLVGGNDALNTVVPYGDPRYYDSRPVVHVPESDVLPIDGRLGFLPAMAALKSMYDDGHVALILGVGYPNRSYSHFRSGDIWETAEPSRAIPDGWLGRASREIDPTGSNPLTAIHFGFGVPRALTLPGVPVASVADLATYGLFVGDHRADQARKIAAYSDVFGVRWSLEHSLMADSDPLLRMRDVLLHARTTASAALRGMDQLQDAAEMTASSAPYPPTPIGEKFRSIARVTRADLGTRIFYLAHGSFDLHALELPGHTARWQELSDALDAFLADLRSDNTADDVAVLMWSEFGRRVRDNGSGTDHGAGGIAFLIGDCVAGGIYGEYPSLRPGALVEGNLDYTVDFRQVYASILERWLGVDSRRVLGSPFEQMLFC